MQKKKTLLVNEEVTFTGKTFTQNCVWELIMFFYDPEIAISKINIIIVWIHTSHAYNNKILIHV